jgi:cytochrome c553
MGMLSRVVFAVALAGAAAAAHAQGTAPGAAAVNDTRTPGEEKALNLCSTCHGPRGASISPMFPNLAAQRPGYLIAQLEAFQAKTREEKVAHDFMYGIAGDLDAAMIRSIAQYYAAQPPAPGHPGDPTLIATGKSLYEKGVPERSIPPCASCHGPQAQGVADFPRLAGQHAIYVVHQIEYIQQVVRKAPVMHGIVKDLTPAEMQAIAMYVQSL